MAMEYPLCTSIKDFKKIPPSLYIQASWYVQTSTSANPILVICPVTPTAKDPITYMEVAHTVQ